MRVAEQTTFLFTMIERTDVDGSKNDVAMNA